MRSSSKELRSYNRSLPLPSRILQTGKHKRMALTASTDMMHLEVQMSALMARAGKNKAILHRMAMEALPTHGALEPLHRMERHHMARMVPMDGAEGEDDIFNPLQFVRCDWSIMLSTQWVSQKLALKATSKADG
jgi:hypothetical protein